MITLEGIKKHLLTGKFYKIAFLGDSITSTEWVHPNWREIIEYVLKFELVETIDDWRIPEWKIRCFNYGFDGAGQEEIVNLIEEDSTSGKLDLSIFVEGCDVGYTTSPQGIIRIRVRLSRRKFSSGQMK